MQPKIVNKNVDNKIIHYITYRPNQKRRKDKMKIKGTELWRASTWVRFDARKGSQLDYLRAQACCEGEG